MRKQWMVFFILMFDLVAFTIILPLFPSIIDYYSHSNTTDPFLCTIYDILAWIRSSLGMPDRKRYNNVLVAGLLGSIYSFLQFLSSPTIGCCSDVYGRKRILVWSMIGSCIAYTLWWQANTFTVFLLSRVVAGITKGSVTLCTAVIADVSTPEDLGKGMALIGLAFSCGFISGPLIGAYFASKVLSDYSTYNFGAPALISLLFQLLSIVLTLLLLPETKPKEITPSTSVCFDRISRLLNPMTMFRYSQAGTINNASVSLLLVAYFLFLLFFSGLEFTLPFLTHERFNFTAMDQGKLLFFAGFIMMIFQGGFVRRMKHNRELMMAMQGIIVLVPTMFLLSITTSVQWIYFAMLFYSFGASTVVPCITSLFTQSSCQSETGENIGVLRSAGALARAVAPFLSCSVYWSCGASFCYRSGAALFVIPLFLLLKIYRRRPHEHQE